jgi:hypothetical protein
MPPVKREFGADPRRKGRVRRACRSAPLSRPGGLASRDDCYVHPIRLLALTMLALLAMACGRRDAAERAEESTGTITSTAASHTSRSASTGMTLVTGTLVTGSISTHATCPGPCGWNEQIARGLPVRARSTTNNHVTVPSRARRRARHAPRSVASARPTEVKMRPWLRRHERPMTARTPAPGRLCRRRPRRRRRLRHPPQPHPTARPL